MRRLTLAGLLVTGLMLGLLPAASAQARPKRCPNAGVVAENTRAKLFIKVHDDSEYTLRGCMKKSRKRTTLLEWFNCGCSTGDQPAPQYELTRRFAAVNRWGCAPDGSICTGTTTVTDLKLRAELRTVDTGGGVSDLVVTTRGNLALIGPHGLQRSDATGQATLDLSPTAGSLAWAAGTHTLYWTTLGLPRSAPLD